MNKIMLIGNLTRDPELTTTPNTGVSLCRFGIAVNDRFTDANGEQKVNFFDVITWRGLADNCQKFLQKGNKVCVVGRLEIRDYEGKDGIKRKAVEVVADDVEFLTPKNSGGGYGGGGDYQPPAQHSAKKPVSQLTPVEDDGLPF
ncbi:MAG: single-stranded DNA-binding protein [Firmicutes bacterium]|nr:single-stranded DNA-binding protein [Bacillota bacterium]